MSLRSLAFAVLVLVVSLPLLGQAGDAQQPAPNSGQAEPSAPAPATGRFRAHHQGLCWRQAGISPDMMNQRWHLEDDAKAKISGVCTDPKLTAEQRLAKIHEIHQQTDADIAKLIPEKQLTAFKACQAEQDKEKASHPSKTPERELGPCGGVIPSSSSMGGQEHNH
jgi:hypothetical protein